MCDVLDLIERTLGVSRTTEHAVRNSARAGLNTGVMNV